MNRKISTCVVTGALTLAATVCGPSPAARAEADVRNYAVAFTNGWGVRLRQAPQIDAAGFGADGKLAIPEGYLFPAECEDYGDTVTNDQGVSTNLWMRAGGGPWVSEAYLETGTNDRVGLPLCSEKDAALQASVEGKTVADYHRGGAHKVMVVNAASTSGRIYYSKAATEQAAETMNSLINQSDLVNSGLCIATSAVIGVATDGILAGVAGDIACGWLTDAARPEFVEMARGAANAAASADKCFEVRLHRDSSSDEWVADVMTVTDHQDYCA